MIMIDEDDHDQDIVAFLREKGGGFIREAPNRNDKSANFDRYFS